MAANILLIWLDASIDENNAACQNTITHLRRTVNTINTFTDSQECIEFLEDMVDEKVCMIISGSLGQQMMPRVHNLSQVDSIFIFCNNKKYHEEWTKNWPKIKNVFTEIGSICDGLKQVAQQCEQNAISISIMGDGDDEMKKSGNRLDSSFMYTQIMKEILLTITFEQKHIDQFLQHCREVFAGNTEQLKYVYQLAHKYREHTPIWWYTCECFLYPMLNRGLRTMDADLMIMMGFFIGDLHRHIERLHQEQFGAGSSTARFTVYRGQGMDKEDFKKMMANKNGLLSFNNFLSTSKNRSTSLGFAQRALTNAQLVGVLFIMNIDPTKSSTPFASVIDVSYFGKKEDEVLFSMHSVFRIGEVTPVGDNARLVQAHMNLVTDKDNDLRQLIDHIRKETFPDDLGWARLGSVLWKMGKFAKAQQVFEMLLRQETKESVKAPIYDQLGMMKRGQGEYAAAIAYYEKSIESEEKQIPRRDRNLARSYTGISTVYFSMGDYPKALSFHEEALTMQQQSLPPTHPDLAISFNNIGSVYQSTADYPKALSFYEKALTIKQQSLPPIHPSLASTYDNMGLLNERMNNYSKAHTCFERAVDIAQRLFPTNHPDLQKWRNNFARIKQKL